MPFLTQEMIDSLKLPDGSYSRHSLYLLGAIPMPHNRETPLEPPPTDWRQRVLMNKIAPRQVMAIKAAARELRSAKQSGNSDSRRHWTRRVHSVSASSVVGVPLKYLRRLRRKLHTAHEHEIKIVDEIIEEAKKASQNGHTA